MNYRYGFNGKEMDNEISGNGNSYDYGARFYDAQLGRWHVVDPLAEKYVSYSPYNYVMGNPIILIDQDGREPNVAQATSVSSFINYLRENKLSTVDDIYSHLKSNAPNVPVRYIYTSKEGWIDMSHVFSVFKNGKLATDMLEPMSGKKIIRETLFHGNGATSYYSYEDLPSNRVGGNMMYLMMLLNDNEDYEGDKLYDFLEKQLKAKGATTPENTPNFNKIPASKDRDVLYDDNGNVRKLTEQELNSGEYVPQNFTDKPYDLDNFPAAPTSFQKKDDNE